MKKFILLFLILPTVVFSGNMEDITDSSHKERYFIGIGGGYNTVQFNQNVYDTGKIDYSGALTGSAQASGAAGPYSQSEPVFSPKISAGFQKIFAENSGYWEVDYWGVKFSYQYLGVAANRVNFKIVMDGNATSGIPNTSGKHDAQLLFDSSQMKLNHEMLLLAFVGHSFENTAIHFGIGPALFGTKTNFNGMTGSLVVANTAFDLFGITQNQSSTNWLIGGGAEVGMSYYFSNQFRLDLNYTYAISEGYKINFSDPFGAVNITSNIIMNGAGSVNSKQYLANQTFTVTIDRVFDI
ncbi:MAG: hypothetical protein K0U24_01215 [Gammaproteobacteria bacterium]|nr:hypothetical protein [Gammaproteobacteria bacterium]MCH9716011.1 hypothetical protein [Gammaproteobacteria bacterium]MCH9762848.1 hypothetical protein [Gammaproteobacteria bacterium]